ncbi:hypothetical protein F0562_027779 [Nyssa sinensis]|uniref:Uncharacterized protein n=1 Tax=Nyssa sinensis TaxID=561372 RepID=A0A5J5BAE9_9ASTE|nr:hypothetical protein F0562_027779 [Nyssa sinensis]
MGPNKTKTRATQIQTSPIPPDLDLQRRRPSRSSQPVSPLHQSLSRSVFFLWRRSAATCSGDRRRAALQAESVSSVSATVLHRFLLCDQLPRWRSKAK